MVLSTLTILAISSSIDSLGIGLTYGIRNTKVTFLSKIVIFLVSFLISLFSIIFGNVIKSFLPKFFLNITENILLIIIGIFILFNSLKINNNTNYDKNNKIYNNSIKDITIKIIKNPTYSDFDNSYYIELKEALFLTLTLSLDSVGICIFVSSFKINILFFPVLLSIFQIFFLTIGCLLGRLLNKSSTIPSNIWSITSSIIIIVIGLLKFVI